MIKKNYAELIVLLHYILYQLVVKQLKHPISQQLAVGKQIETKYNS